MSNHPDYHSAPATDTPRGVRHPTENYQRSPTTSVPASSPATLLGDLGFPSPSSGFAGVTVDPLYRSPSTLYAESASGYGTVLAPPEQSLTPGSSSASFRQPLLVNDEPADMFPELGQSVASGAFEATQQEPSDFDAVMDEIMQAPVVRHTTGNTCSESGDELFRTSFASKADLTKLSKIYADVSMADPLACCQIKQLHVKDYDVHVQVGRFYYDEAFASKGEDVVLKVTNQNSGRIVGCAWLQLLPYPRSDIEIWPYHHDSVPECIKQTICPYIHRLRYEQIQTTIKEKERQTNILPHYLIRSLDLPRSLSTEHRLQVHRQLLSFISGFKPEHQIFAQVADAFQPEMITFLDLGWAFTGDVCLGANRCPVVAAPSLRACPIEYKTLSGFLRRATAEPEQQQSLSNRTDEASQQRPIDSTTPQSCQRK